MQDKHCSTEKKMKPYFSIIILLVAGIVFTGGCQTKGPAQTPEELGKRVAQALIAGDKNSLGVLLPPYEAYLPMCSLNLGEGTHAKTDLQKFYSKRMGKLKEEIQAFPSEFARETSFKTSQIDAIDVYRQKVGSRTNWTDVDVIFRVKDAKFLLTLDECLRFNNAWYLVDLDWMGKQK